LGALSDPARCQPDAFAEAAPIVRQDCLQVRDPDSGGGEGASAVGDSDISSPSLLNFIPPPRFLFLSVNQAACVKWARSNARHHSTRATRHPVLNRQDFSANETFEPTTLASGDGALSLSPVIPATPSRTLVSLCRARLLRVETRPGVTSFPCRASPRHRARRASPLEKILRGAFRLTSCWCLNCPCLRLQLGQLATILTNSCSTLADPNGLSISARPSPCLSPPLRRRSAHWRDWHRLRRPLARRQPHATDHFLR